MHCLYFIRESKFYARKNYAAVWKSTIRQVVEVASSSKYLIAQPYSSGNCDNVLRNVTPQYTIEQDFPAIIFSHPTWY